MKFGMELVREFGDAVIIIMWHSFSSHYYVIIGFTVFRNTWLFALFVVYVDISKQIVPGGLGTNDDVLHNKHFVDVV